MNFAKVSRSLWRSRKFKSLKNTDERLLYLYLLTCPHGNAAGCFVLPDAYACADLGFDQRQLDDCKLVLEGAGLIETDASEEVVLITNWFAFNKPQNPKHKAGILKDIAEIPSARLRERCQAGLQQDTNAPPELPPDADGIDTVSEPYRNKQSKTEIENKTETGTSALAARDGPPDSPALDLRKALAGVWGEAGIPRAPPDTGCAAVWLAKGYRPDLILAVIREVLPRKPNVVSWAYFEKRIAEAHATPDVIPLPQGVRRNGSTRQTSTLDVIDRELERELARERDIHLLASHGSEGGEGHPRLIQTQRRG